MTTERLLAVICSNPATTSGVRTTNRAKQACTLLGYQTFEISNLLNIPTYRTGEVSHVAAERSAWVIARDGLSATISKSSGILLAYGIDKPSGLARLHHAEQVSWLEQEIAKRSLPTWAVGGEPRHPSRWQRFTHRSYPGTEFETALALSLKRIEVGT
ncbi:hypothetical protein QE367_000391 [Microbacterium paludicola]|uniref:Uncharacterized protein n=1 Tax=Microbacterium paludicola TaxID=300019 RepID=A0ABU1HX19_9MICO|nr:hypothetical protein [Microbacterium paludicola]